MIAAIPTLVLTLIQLPGPWPVMPDELNSSTSVLCLSSTETHLRALNSSADTWWLALGVAGSEHEVLVRLDPGSEHTWPLYSGPSSGLLVEALRVQEGTLLGSGALSLETLRAGDQGTLWVRDEGLRAGAYRERDARIERLQSSQSRGMPQAPGAGVDYGSDFGGDHGDASIPTVHVPVITPGDGVGEIKPPVIDEKPLPPV